MHETFFRLALRLSDLIKRHRFRDGNCKTAACNVISEFVEARRIRLSHESCHAHIVMSGVFGRAKDRAEDSDEDGEEDGDEDNRRGRGGRGRGRRQGRACAATRTRA